MEVVWMGNAHKPLVMPEEKIAKKIDSLYPQRDAAGIAEARRFISDFSGTDGEKRCLHSCLCKKVGLAVKDAVAKDGAMQEAWDYFADVVRNGTKEEKEIVANGLMGFLNFRRQGNILFRDSGMDLMATDGIATPKMEARFEVDAAQIERAAVALAGMNELRAVEPLRKASEELAKSHGPLSALLGEFAHAIETRWNQKKAAETPGNLFEGQKPLSDGECIGKMFNPGSGSDGRRYSPAPHVIVSTEREAHIHVRGDALENAEPSKFSLDNGSREDGVKAIALGWGLAGSNFAEMGGIPAEAKDKAVDMIGMLITTNGWKGKKLAKNIDDVLNSLSLLQIDASRKTLEKADELAGKGITRAEKRDGMDPSMTKMLKEAREMLKEIAGRMEKLRTKKGREPASKMEDDGSMKVERGSEFEYHPVEDHKDKAKDLARLCALGALLSQVKAKKGGILTEMQGGKPNEEESRIFDLVNNLITSYGMKDGMGKEEKKFLKAVEQELDSLTIFEIVEVRKLLKGSDERAKKAASSRHPSEEAEEAREIVRGAAAVMKELQMEKENERKGTKAKPHKKKSRKKKNKGLAYLYDADQRDSTATAHARSS